MGFLRQEYWSGLPFPSRGDQTWSRSQTCISCIGRCVLYHWATWEAPKDFLALYQFNQALTLLWQIFKASYLGSMANEQSWFFFLGCISVAVSLHRMFFPRILVELNLPSLRSMLREALLIGLPKIFRSACHLSSLGFLFSQPSLHPQSFHISTSLLPVSSL